MKSNTGSTPPRIKGFELFLASFIGLYFEMLIIRWLAAEVRLFSYFKNITMMAAFLGLGIGFALARSKKDYWKLFTPFLLVFVGIIIAVGKFLGPRVIVPETGEYLWITSDLSLGLSSAIFTSIVILFFLYTMTMFILPGQLIGKLMKGWKPITAYIINLAGSLVGIWAFAYVSYLYLPPAGWFTVGLAGVLWFSRADGKQFVINGVLSVVIVGVLIGFQGETLWSPYYRVDVNPLGAELNEEDPWEAGYDLLVNQIGFMTAVNLSEDYLEENPEYGEAISYFDTIYNFPYALVEPEKVLVVGAGTGNDVAAALRAGVQDVSGVEIDPLIYEFAREYHPEAPYDSEYVDMYIDDARAYFEKTDEKFDLIVFGILDSQTLLSGMSNVRLDNFVYTFESIEQAHALLDDDGMISVTFFAKRWWIKQRLADMLETVFEEPPVEVVVDETDWVMFLIGGGIDSEKISAACATMTCTVVDEPTFVKEIPLATDDWPYLYLQDKGIPLQYWIVLVIVVVTAWVGTQRAFPEARGINWHYFFLGGAFLLIEFKSITELALLFGSTWVVNAVAITAVLIMVMIANILVSKLDRINVKVLYGLLGAALLVGFGVPLDVLLPYSGAARVLGAVVLVGLPLFFSSMIFSVSLKVEKDVTLAFASTFFGSAVGGVLEYVSLAFGIRSLYLIGALLYLASWRVLRRAKK